MQVRYKPECIFPKSDREELNLMNEEFLRQQYHAKNKEKLYVFRNMQN